MTDTAYLDFCSDFSKPHIVTAFDELPLWSAMFGLLLFEELSLRDTHIVLDIACGTGFPLIELAERLGPTSEVHGLDVWTAGLARAREKIAARGTPNVTLHEASAASMPFADAYFDLIVSNLGVNNFDDREAALAECRRVAKNGARIALTTTVQGHMREFYAVFESVLRERGDAESLERLRQNIEHRATVAGLRDLLPRHRFEVRRVVQRQGLMRFASGTALFNHHFIKFGFLDGWKSVVPGKEAEVFATLEKRLNEAGEIRLTVPLLYMEAAAV